MSREVYIKKNIDKIADNVYIVPNIPDKIMRIAVNTMAPGISTDSVVAIVDSNPFGGGKTGCIFTRSGMHLKTTFSENLELRYDEIEKSQFNPFNISKSDKKNDQRLKIILHLKDGTKLDISKQIKWIRVEAFSDFLNGIIVSEVNAVDETTDYFNVMVDDIIDLIDKNNPKNANNDEVIGDRVEGVIKTGNFVGKVLGSAVIGTAGVLSTVAEKVGDASDNYFLKEIAYLGKSASFNTVRKMWGKETKKFDYEDGSSLRLSAERIQEVARGQKEQEFNDEVEKRQSQLESVKDPIESAILKKDLKLFVEKYRRSDEEWFSVNKKDNLNLEFFQLFV